MKYKKELFTWVGSLHGNKELKEKMFQYLGEGQKITHGVPVSDFYTYDHLIETLTLFFKDKEVQEMISQDCLKAWNTQTGKYPEFEFETTYDKNKYYTIFFTPKRNSANILPIRISIVSENHLDQVIE